MKLIFLVLIVAIVMADVDFLGDFYLNDLFTSRLLTEVVDQHQGKSVVQSGFSVLTPLALLSLASGGKTHDELLNVLHSPDDKTTIEVFTQLNKVFRNVKGVELKTANKLYVNHLYELNSDFAVVSKDVFNTEVENIDFTQRHAAANNINAWVEDHTNKRINNIVTSDSFSGLTKAVLVNAIYFKGTWKQEFNAKLTRDRNFHVSNYQTVKLPFMHKKADFLYATSSELDAALLQLPYEGEEASFLVVLPNKIDGLADLTEKLKDTRLLDKALDNMENHTVRVYLPKFKIETETDLKEALKKMGVSEVFSHEANLTKLLKTRSGLFINDAKQKAFIEVNEKGAEAAGSNVVDAVWTVPGLPPKPVYTFVADRPFYFELRFKNTPLFNGVLLQ